MNTPVRLNKKETPDDMSNIEVWILNHTHIFLPLALIILFALIIALIYAITGVSAVESGNYYNHLQDVI